MSDELRTDEMIEARLILQDAAEERVLQLMTRMDAIKALSDRMHASGQYEAPQTTEETEAIIAAIKAAELICRIGQLSAMMAQVSENN